MANEYCTAAEVKSRLDITGTTYDVELASVISAVSRAIDARLNRHFYTATETRYYTAQWLDWLIIDDCQSVTTLATDDDGDGVYETEWDSGDFLLSPFNAGTDGYPYCDIVLPSPRPHYFPLGTPKGVKIVGVFGYSASVPPAIKEACILASMRVWKRRDVLFGVSGSAELGTVQAIAQILSDGELRLLLEAVPVRIV